MRRSRIDIGQASSKREQETKSRKSARWTARNKNAPPEDNPFLEAIRPIQATFGDSAETKEILQSRLSNLEYGNYPGYFNFRNKPADADSDKNGFELGQADERLTHLKKEWFEGKDVLDIGCNRGHLTYAIAKLYKPKHIIGTDIDLKLINMANRDLHLHLERGMISERQQKRQERAARLKLEGQSQYEEDPDDAPLADYLRNGPLTSESTSDFPNNIVFVEHNYVVSDNQSVDKQRSHLDTIMCLSVTKWIHLNYRDDGLKRFFRRAHNHLKPGGIFILEAQPFENYNRKRKLSDRLKSNYASIQFKPEEFDNYLLGDEVGFESIIYQSTTEHESSGFRRPIKVFRKKPAEEG